MSGTSKTTYIVSGYMRTGTSMMMQALEAGGLTAAYDKNRDKLNAVHGDAFYTPNKGGYYELSKKDYQSVDFPRKHQGKLIKVLGRGLWGMVAGRYKIVLMRRDYEEIRQSFEAFFNQPLPLNENEYEDMVSNTKGIAGQRNDMELIEVWYRDAVLEPRGTFELLKRNGWPVDVDESVKVVDPTLMRFRKEDLTIGI